MSFNIAHTTGIVDYLKGIEHLHNRYIILRHGESLANYEKIVISDPDNGYDHYGLTRNGEIQVRTVILEALETGLIDSNTLLYSSCFLRATETACITQAISGAKSLCEQTQLDERFFGNWEKTSSDNYQKVWAEDKENPYHSSNKVESVMHVLHRITLLIFSIEKLYQGKTILLIGHGDPLQILRTAFLRVPPATHHESPLKNAEMQELVLHS